MLPRIHNEKQRMEQSVTESYSVLLRKRIVFSKIDHGGACLNIGDTRRCLRRFLPIYRHVYRLTTVLSTG